MDKKYPIIIVGGGQAGLATSYFLTRNRQEHIVLEQSSQAGNAWRNDRWDSFVLNTPNWTFRLPGDEYAGGDPDGFMPRQEIVKRFEQYVERFHLPVQYGMRVSSVEAHVNGTGYRVQTEQDNYEVSNVVIATGLFQRPNIPAFSKELPAHILQLHSGQYRNPESLPAGAVLVVGSGQSGCQIAEELYKSGRKVYLCVGSAVRTLRRYRGKDAFEWMQIIGLLDRTEDKLQSPKMKFAANPQLTGRDGGRDLNLHQFARDGVTLLGRIQDGRYGKVWLASDLHGNLARADNFAAEFAKQVDAYIASSGMVAPQESLPVLRDGFDQKEVSQLDLISAGINTIIWAAGYAFDFNLVKLPAFDSDGFPVQKRGVTGYPGLYFIGLPWMYKFKSGLLLGVGEDAEYITDRILGRGD